MDEIAVGSCPGQERAGLSGSVRSVTIEQKWGLSRTLQVKAFWVPGDIIINVEVPLVSDRAGPVLGQLESGGACVGWRMRTQSLNWGDGIMIGEGLQCVCVGVFPSSWHILTLASVPGNSMSL